MKAAQTTQVTANRYLAQIHITAKSLRTAGVMSQDDYQTFALSLTGLPSSAQMTMAQRHAFLKHLQKLEGQHGLAATKAATPKRVLSPQEKKIWALWYSLEKAGLVVEASTTQARALALRRFVKRMTGYEDLRFCSDANMTSLIEAMKKWLTRDIAPKESL